MKEKGQHGNVLVFR